MDEVFDNIQLDHRRSPDSGQVRSEAAVLPSVDSLQQPNAEMLGAISMILRESSPTHQDDPTFETCPVSAHPVKASSVTAAAKNLAGVVDGHVTEMLQQATSSLPNDSFPPGCCGRQGSDEANTCTPGASARTSRPSALADQPPDHSCVLRCCTHELPATLTLD